MRRIEAIDVARGIAALSVALYHYGFGKVLVAQTGWRVFQLVGWPGSNFAVPLFFVISGFCIHGGHFRPGGATVSPLRFFAQRLLRIYPAWLVAIGVSVAAVYLSGAPGGTGGLAKYFLLTNGFFDDYRLNLALWSVSVECALYLLYPGWLWCRQRWGLAAALAIVVAVSLASCLVTARVVGAPKGVSLWFFLNVWVGWIAGAVFAELWLSSRRTWLGRPAWWGAGALLVGFHLGLIQLGAYGGAGRFVQLPVTIVLCVWPLSLLLWAGDRIPGGNFPRALLPGWRVLAGVGTFSYSLYLLHVPVQSLRSLVAPLLHGSHVAEVLLFAGWFGVVLAVAWLCYHLVEVPALRWGRPWIDRLWPAAGRATP